MANNPFKLKLKAPLASMLKQNNAGISLKLTKYFGLNWDIYIQNFISNIGIPSTPEYLGYLIASVLIFEIELEGMEEL